MIAEFRPNARSGLWMTFLIPIALFISTSTITYNALPRPPQNHDVIICILALEMCMYSTFYAVSLFPTKEALFLDNAAEIQQKLHFKIIWKPTVYIMISSLLLSLFVGSGIFIPLLSFVAMMTYIQALPMIWTRFRKSFTFGEGVLVLQSGVLFGVKFISNIFCDVHDPTTIGISRFSGSFDIIAMVGLASLLILCLMSYFFPIINSPTLFYTIGLASFCGLSYPFLWWKLKKDPIMWIFNYVFGNQRALSMFSIWIICILCAFLIVMNQSSKATTVNRKYFHALVVIVYTSGILIDVNFLYLSSIVSLCIMLLLEHIRFHKIEPLAAILNRSFQAFKDDKDVGDLVLTNLYLLAGVSLPLWISNDLTQANSVLLLSGVLSIGVGDSFASIIGSKWGRIKLIPYTEKTVEGLIGSKWGKIKLMMPYTEKTVEGLIASVLSQVIFVKLLQIGNFVNFRPILIISIFVTSVLETITTQVDNLALPLVMYILNSIL